MTVKTRFAPSPTGYLHIGGVRTALFSWLLARKSQGSFTLRIEDTDRERSTQEAVDVIIEGMQWLGLDWDEGPIFQTHRFERYKEIVDQLLDQGDAYKCYCTKDELDAVREEQLRAKQKPRYNRKCRNNAQRPSENAPYVIRFKNPIGDVVQVNDLIRGHVTVQNDELDDLILVRSDGTPTFNLTVVVDDLDLGITHVVRGVDHLNNTPRQINIMLALNAQPPHYAHLPMILGDDGQLLSKRHGAVSVLQYRDEGYLPQALLNYLVRLGWSHGDQEIFSIEEMIDFFDLSKVHHSAAAFNADKLKWLNQHYIRTLPPETVAEHLAPQMQLANVDVSNGPSLATLVALQADRVETLKEMAIVSRYFYEEFDHYDEKAAKKTLKQNAIEPLNLLREAFEQLTEWSDATIDAAITAILETHDLKLGKVAQPLRVAITGGSASPAIAQTAALIGKDRVISRIDRALAFIEEKLNANN